MLLQARHRHDDLERRPRRQLRLDRLVQQRMIRVVQDLVPVALRQPHRKLVWIERRPRHHRQDLARMRVHRHDRPHLAFQRLLRRLLHVQVDRQPQVLPRHRQLCPSCPSSLPCSSRSRPASRPCPAAAHRTSAPHPTAPPRPPASRTHTAGRSASLPTLRPRTRSGAPQTRPADTAAAARRASPAPAAHCGAPQ